MSVARVQAPHERRWLLQPTGMLTGVTDARPQQPSAAGARGGLETRSAEPSKCAASSTSTRRLLAGSAATSTVEDRRRLSAALSLRVCLRRVRRQRAIMRRLSAPSGYAYGECVASGRWSRQKQCSRRRRALASRVRVVSSGRRKRCLSLGVNIMCALGISRARIERG